MVTVAIAVAEASALHVSCFLMLVTIPLVHAIFGHGEQLCACP